MVAFPRIQKTTIYKLQISTNVLFTYKCHQTNAIDMFTQQQIMSLYTHKPPPYLQGKG